MSLPIPNKTTIYKSVKLQSGESFTLPPDAVLVSSTDSSAITSTCDIGDLEDLECYTFVFGNAATDGGSNQFFEAWSFPVIGVSINNVYKEFPTPFLPSTSGSVVGQYDLTSLVIAINNATGGALINPQIGEHNEGDAGIIEFITFRAMPAIVSTLQLKMVTSAAPAFNEDENIQIWLKPRLTSDLSNYSGIPECI